MQLKRMYDIQKTLSKVITGNMDCIYNKEVMLTMNLLALQVEVSEFANATSCFKYWKKKKIFNKGEMLEEYVDILHLVLEIGNLMDYDPNDIEKAFIEKHTKNILRQKEGY